MGEGVEVLGYVGHDGSFVRSDVTDIFDVE